MNYIIKYQNFSESKGISDSCEKVLYKIWNIIQDDIYNFKSSNILFNIEEDDFNVKDLEIEFSIEKSNERICYGETILKNSKILDNNLIGSSIKLNIKMDNIDDEFKYIATKLDISVDELKNYFYSPKKYYWDYKNSQTLFRVGANILRFIGAESVKKRSL